MPLHRRLVVTLALFSMACQTVAAPPNDECTNAQVVTLGNNPFTNVGANVAAPGTCAPIGADVWFKFTSTFTGTLWMNTCVQTNFNTVIAVYSGCACTTFNQLACNANFPNCGGGGSYVEVPVQAGACYRIRVGGVNGASGSGVLRLGVKDPQNAASADLKRDGQQPGDRFGFSVAGNGWINGDTIEDILVGAYLNKQKGNGAGRAYAYRGGNLNSLFTKNGPKPGDNFGYSVALADVNGDGRDDLIIGAPGSDINGVDSGCVYAYSGVDGKLLWKRKGQAAGDRLGFSVASAGYYNTDPHEDIIVGAPYNAAGGANAGRAYVLNGKNGKILRTFTGAAGDLLGWSVTGIGDLNGNGKDDVAVGAPGRTIGSKTQCGQVIVYAGGNGNVLRKLNGDAAGDQFGYAVAGQRFTAGGMNYVMLAVGAPFNTTNGNNSGRVKVFLRNITNPNLSGCNQILCLKYTMNGGNPGDRLGWSVAIGDMIGNAVADIVVGAPTIGLNGANSGAIYLFDGASGILAKRFYGETAGDQFGTAIAIAGDINNDGNDDLLVGAPLSDVKGIDSGRAYVFHITRAGAMMAGPGTASLRPGDVTGDGRIDQDDLAEVIAAWGACRAGEPCPADLNGDGMVDSDDLLEVLNHWNALRDPVVVVR